MLFRSERLVRAASLVDRVGGDGCGGRDPHAHRAGSLIASLPARREPDALRHYFRPRIIVKLAEGCYTKLGIENAIYCQCASVTHPAPSWGGGGQAAG